MNKKPLPILTITLNPSIDHVITVDSISVHSKNNIISEKKFFGGKGINVAFTLGKLGADCFAVAIIGKDDVGSFEQKLQRVKVKTKFILNTGNTRNNFKLIDQDSGKDTEFNGVGFRVLDKELSKIEAILDELFRNTGWLILSGSLPLGVSSDYYQKLIEKAKENSLTTCLDASGKPLKSACSARPDILRINQSELEELSGKKLQQDEQIIREMIALYRQGINRIIISSGSSGVIAFDGKEFIKADVPRIKAVSPTGAGDAMTAALINQFSKGTSFLESVKFGAALASASTMRTEPGDFLDSDLQEILRKVVVQEINL